MELKFKVQNNPFFSYFNSDILTPNWELRIVLIPKGVGLTLKLEQVQNNPSLDLF